MTTQDAATSKRAWLWGHMAIGYMCQGGPCVALRACRALCPSLLHPRTLHIEQYRRQKLLTPEAKPVSRFVDVWLAIAASDSSSNVLEEPDALEEPAAPEAPLDLSRTKT